MEEYNWQHCTCLDSDGHVAVGESQIGLRDHAFDVAGDVTRGGGKVGGHIELDAQLSGGCCINLESVQCGCSGCRTGNGKTGQTVHTGQCGLFGPLIHFQFDIHSNRTVGNFITF